MMVGRADAPGVASGVRLDAGHVLGSAAFLAPGLALFAPLGLAPLLAVTAVAAVAVGRLRGHSWPSVPRGFAAIFALVLLWALVTLSWTPEPRMAAGKLGELALLFAACLIVFGVGRDLDLAQAARVERWLAAGFVLAVALLLVEVTAGYPIRHLHRADWPAPHYLWQSFDRGSTILALLVWPAARAIARRSSLAAGALWLATAALVASLSSATAKVAFAAGLVAFVLARVAPRTLAAALAVITVLVIVAMPLIASRVPPAEVMEQRWPFNAATPAPGKNAVRSALHRLLIWHTAAEHVATKPVFGWGFNASRWLPAKAVPESGLNESVPLHPHNMPLQWWVELGLPGAALGSAAALLALGGLRRTRDPHSIAAGVALGATAVTIAGLSYGAWQSWWVSALALAATVAVASARGDAVRT